MTSDFDWARFRAAFGGDPGVLPDGEVVGSTEHDWDAVFAMLQHSGWKLTTSDGHSPLPPNRQGLAELESFAVWPDEVVEGSTAVRGDDGPRDNSRSSCHSRLHCSNSGHIATSTVDANTFAWRIDTQSI